MELRQLRYFVAVADEGHVTRAAQALHVAQPTVSQGIGQLERELGVQLFERSGRGVALTPAGVRLLAEARVALRHVQRIEELARLLVDGRDGLVRVGCLPLLEDGMVLRAARLLRSQRPQVEVALREVGLSSRLDALRGGDIDVALFPAPFEGHDVVAGPVVHRGGRVLAVARGHALAARTRVGPEDLAGEVMPSLRLQPLPPWARTWLPPCTPTGRAIHAGGEVETVGELLVGVASERFVALLPAEIVEVYRRDDIVFRPVEDDPYEVVPVWRAGGGSMLIDAFVRALREAGETGRPAP